MKDRQGFGNRIKEMREQRNLTIEQAAELCDCSESTWKQYVVLVYNYGHGKLNIL